ncbi:hypothetical protein [Pseudomonas agarici]|uniref:hypothetical protein n=1 Tax=Pseudomonas agarici TaxID=46677 RepID=UPI00036B1E80|nr:hypothetical protein [Pseudomonas agarici]NWB91361.1 hypothetical protein [Pseudomonas agarici]NWC07909.1 hypothetical protein [Pseudomonas agarici]SEK77611.1 hypothetical protein SAMN05216604_106180 [Pseudomonas agarici]
MTSIDTWPSWIAIIVTGGPGLLGLASIAFSLYLSRRHLDAIKEALKNSRYIYIWGPRLGNRGLIWSLLEIAKITGMIMMPRASLRIGELDPVDLENFPSHLKRLLKIDFAIMMGSGIWMVIVYVLLKFK